MPYLETPQELAEKIADWCEIYGTDDDPEKRQHFVSEVVDRIREAAENEKLIARREDEQIEAEYPWPEPPE